MDNYYARFRYHCSREMHLNVNFSKSTPWTITMQSLAITAEEKHTLM